MALESAKIRIGTFVCLLLCCGWTIAAAADSHRETAADPTRDYLPAKYFERMAREGRRGIWSLGYYAIRTPETAAKHINSFELIEGNVLDVGIVAGRAYLNFGENWRSDFTITLDKAALRRFSQEGIRPDRYKGHRVRVRGWLQSRDGPMIEATHPDQIEVIDE